MKALIKVNNKGYIGMPELYSPQADKYVSSLIGNSNCLFTTDALDKFLLPCFVGGTFVAVVIDTADSFDEKQVQTIDWVLGGLELLIRTLPFCDEIVLILLNNNDIGEIKCPDLSDLKAEIIYEHFDCENYKTEKEIAIGAILKDEIATIGSILKDVILPELEKQTDLLSELPGMNQICKHDIFEQQLINSGKTPKEAAMTPRHLFCNCPKCSKYF